MGDASATRSTTVNAPVETVWATLAAFDRLSTWSPEVDHSTYLTEQREGVGSARRVQVGRTVLVERITEWDPPRALAYALEGLPPVVGGATNRWTLRAEGDRTFVTLTSTVDPGAKPVGPGGRSARRPSPGQGVRRHARRPRRPPDRSPPVTDRPDIVIILTDEERAAPPYEDPAVARWRHETLAGERWFAEHGVAFARHYTGSLACVPSRPTMFTGQYPDLHGVTQTDGLGKMADDSRMRWLPAGEVPTLGNWFRAGGYDTHYDGKWHISHADLTDPATGKPLATNTDDGEVLADAVAAYLDADPLAPYGFSGWVGPEPHGAPWPTAACAGTRSSPTGSWPGWRTATPAAAPATPSAQRPFLLVASFVNPHDIVLFPLWQRTKPLDDEPSPLDPPPVPEAPTEHEDLRNKPAAQIAYRAAYPSGYGPPAAIARIYERNAQAYRDLYHRLHAEVDGPVDRVRRAVTDGGSDDAVLVRTADHGELLGAHGGLHQKWFNLYDEATRVPFTIARVGSRTTAPLRVEAPTSHIDLVPTLLAAAGLDATAAGPPTRRGLQRGPRPAGHRPDAGGRRRGRARRRPGRLPHDPGQHARGRQRCLRGGPASRPHGPPSGAPAHPGPGPRGVELRGRGGPGGRRRRPGRGRPPLEAGPDLRRSQPPGPSPRSATSPPRAWAGPATAASPSPTSGSSTTSTPIRSRPTTGRTTRSPPTSSPCCAGA